MSCSGKFFLWSLVFFCVSISCENVASRLREYTYPPDFRYISQEQLRSTMWQLAYHSRELNQLLRSPDTTLQNRTEIVDQLRSMEEAAAALSGWPTNHPVVDKNLPNFRQDLKIARESVEREPPNFLPAASLSHGCAYCHGKE